MAGFRSWLGALLTVVVFVAGRCCALGAAAPLLATLAFSLLYSWFAVLRVPVFDDQAADQSRGDNDQQCESLSEDLGREADLHPSDDNVAIDADGAEPAARDEMTASPCKTASEYPTVVGASADPTARDEMTASPYKNASEYPTVVGAAAQCTEASACRSAADIWEHPAGMAATGAPASINTSAPVADSGNVDGAADSDDESTAGVDVPGSSVPEVDAIADKGKALELKSQGNELFKAGKIQDAREAYSEALHYMPTTDKADTAALHANRAACMMSLKRWEAVIEDCTAAVDIDATYLKAYRRRSVANEALEKWNDALEDLKKAIEIDPTIKTQEYRRQAVLEQRSAAQFEKDKEEMVAKLKDLGNMVLGKFGMSCDNFKMEQDPNTGGYSMKFQN